MWSFPGSCENRGSGTQQASSDVVPVTGLDAASGTRTRPLGSPVAGAGLRLGSQIPKSSTLQGGGDCW